MSGSEPAGMPMNRAGHDRHVLEDYNMNGQVVLITGALTGIGRAAAVAFAKKGANDGRCRSA